MRDNCVENAAATSKQEIRYVFKGISTNPPKKGLCTAGQNLSLNRLKAHL